MTLRLAIIFLAVFVLHSPTLAEGNPDEILLSFKQHQAAVVTNIEKAQAELPQLWVIVSEVQRLEKRKNDKNKGQHEEISKQIDAKVEKLFETYGPAILAMQLLYDFDLDHLPKKQLEEGLRKAKHDYQESMECFMGGKLSDRTICQKFSTSCAQYGYNNGKMYVIALTKNLEKHEEDVTNGDPAIEDSPWFKVIGKGVFEFCKLRGMENSYVPKSLRVNEARIIDDNYGGMVLPYPDTYKEQCTDMAPSQEHLERFYQLQAEFPEALSYSEEQYQKWKKACRNAASDMCSNAYVVKDQVILTYVTKDCRQRDVTKEDVERDMEQFETNAEKLNHSFLLDYIGACQSAHDAGSFWPYKKPSITGCKNPEKAKKKKRK